jgi:hypothetical protein
MIKTSWQSLAKASDTAEELKKNMLNKKLWQQLKSLKLLWIT